MAANTATIADMAIGPIRKGGFHRWLGKGPKSKITGGDIKKGLAAGGHAAKMANFARNAKKFHHGKSLHERAHEKLYSR